MKLPAVLLALVALPAWAIAQTAPAPAATTPETNPATAPATAPAKKLPAPTKAVPGTTTATKSGSPSTKSAAATKSTATAKTTAAKGAADKSKKKDEPPPKIEGMEIARGAKGFLGLQVANGNFKLTFYDPKKKTIAPDVVRAVLRWTPNYKPGTEIYVLGPGDGKSLTAAKVVRPPYTFKLFMSLFAEGAENPVESYVLDFSQ